MLKPYQIRQFYLRGFKPHLNDWPRIWNKQFKAKALEGHFIKLNGNRRRLNFRSLLSYSVELAPVHLYMSVLNWLMPERVGKKSSANGAYPIGGEYVIDVDFIQMWRPFGNHASNSIHFSGLQRAYDRTFEVTDKIKENYSDIRIVFSGKRGFHIHVLDFNVRDWTHYDEGNPIKSHEVVRFLYTRHLQSACGGFDRHHFLLSSDPMRVMTVPGSLNGETGLICFDAGSPTDLERLTLAEVVSRSDSRRFIYKTGFHNLAESVPHSHPEPTLDVRR
jgi:hypothetical protein